MIIDVTGIELIPCNNGLDCPGNGKGIDSNGNMLECCCDECDYMICCFATQNYEICNNCTDSFCPRVNNVTE